ncbi:MAG: ROK family protein [Kiritimatiellae bacterium]|nr:ROK family protein [Kiritimatiellia bacterium]
MSISIGIDIGGTKCALSVGDCTADSVRILHREEFPTAGKTWQETLEEFTRRIPGAMQAASSDSASFTIGISCGGPLDSRRGVILSPPNLPGWDDVPAVRFFEERFGVPVHLQNDANACAYAEWKFGAGRGTRNMVFMTFGTGLGAGLVLDGRLYSGTNDNAGEIGHIRLAPTGPVGYNKEGSAEGFCSGAGIVRLARIRAAEKGVELPGDFSAKELFRRIDAGDEFCAAVFRESASHLATILSYTIDILNPEVIVLGGVFMRQHERFMREIEPIIAREALPLALRACRIVPAGLSENIGDYAALAVANMEG